MKMLPSGPWDLIYADPPWKFDYALPSVGQNIEGRHYECMDLEGICRLPVAEMVAKDAVLMLWSVSPKLEEALTVMRTWGFSYRQQIVWEKLTPLGKQNSGMGHWVRGNHETLLLGIRGNPGAPPDRGKRPHSVFRAPRRRHSEKPDEVYEFLDGMFPHLQKRLELFARKTHPGWVAWGLEINDEISCTGKCMD